MSAKEAFQEVAKIMTPVKGRFLNDDVVEMNMLFINNKLGRKENIVNYFQISENKKILSQVHNSDEVLVGYSKNGDIKAMIRSIQFKKTMPLNTPKVGENVMVLEIVKDGEVLVEEILNDENGKPYLDKPQLEDIHLSLSHCEQYAVAFVVVESN